MAQGDYPYVELQCASHFSFLRGASSCEELSAQAEACGLDALSIMYPNRQHLAPQARAFIDWVSGMVAASASEWLHPVADTR
ncbi:hypothetical protein [Novosphingobium sp.]|jgi:hypothetical protein|uniref:hypothetical protein n=1 Tax=Novosphingobium sp. TaxID=1874826 RepID=UPI002FE4189F